VIRDKLFKEMSTLPTKFSIGLLLIFLLEGHFLFDEENYERIIEKIGESNYVLINSK